MSKTSYFASNYVSSDETLPYQTFFRGAEIDNRGETLRVFETFERSCDARPKKGFKCEGLDHTKLKGVRYVVKAVNVRAELERLVNARVVAPAPAAAATMTEKERSVERALTAAESFCSSSSSQAGQTQEDAELEAEVAAIEAACAASKPSPQRCGAAPVRKGWGTGPKPAGFDDSATAYPSAASSSSCSSRAAAPAPVVNENSNKTFKNTQTKRQSQKRQKKDKKAKITIETRDVGSRIEPVCDVLVSGMTSRLSLQLAVTLVSTLYDAPVYRGLARRTKAESWELCFEGVSLERACEVQRLVCALLYQDESSNN